MQRSTTALPRGTAVLVGALALVHLVGGLSPDTPAYASVTVLGAGVVSSVAALSLHRGHTVTARLMTWVAAAVSAGGAVLVGVLGLPGRAPSGFGAAEWGVLALALAIVVLLVLDARKCPSTRAAPPYAL